jgi:hypothetical protein
MHICSKSILYVVQALYPAACTAAYQCKHVVVFCVMHIASLCFLYQFENMFLSILM